MAFHHVVKVPQIIGTGKVVFVKLPLKEWDKINIGSVVAIIEFGGKKLKIKANFSSYMMEYLVSKGDEIEIGSAFLKLAAEGEDLPYEKPDCTVTEH